MKVREGFRSCLSIILSTGQLRGGDGTPVQGPGPPPLYKALAPMLVTSSHQDQRSVQLVHLRTSLYRFPHQCWLTSGGWSTYGGQASGTHPHGMLSCTSVPSVSNTWDVSAVDYSDTDAWADSQRNNVTSFNVQLKVQWTTNIEFHRLGIFLPWEWEFIPTMWNLKQKFNNFIFGDLSCTEQRAIKVKLRLIVSTFNVLSCLTRRTNSVNSILRISFIVKIESFHQNDMLLMSTDLIGSFMFIVKTKFDEMWPSVLWLANSQSWVNEKLNFVKVSQWRLLLDASVMSRENPQKVEEKQPRQSLRWIF